MRFYNRQHRHYCEIDLHVKTMYVCIVDTAGQVLVHRNVTSTPEAFLEVVAPYREDLVVAAECMFTWYWLADLCAAEGIGFVLGHALAMQAIHGGKATNDKLDSSKIASLLRGGLWPQAYVYPAAMRSTRDLRRRRLHLVRKRGQLLAHLQNTRAPYNLPAFEKRVAYPGNRDGVVEHVPDPSVRTSIEVDVALIDQYDALVHDLELTIVREAKRHDAYAFHRLRSVPGIGQVLALTILYETHDITRCDRVQAFASYARLVACQHQSAGKTRGTGGAKMGNVHLKWPSRKAPGYSSDMPQAGRRGWPALRRTTAKERLSRFSRTSWDGPCTTCCRAGRCSHWTRSGPRSGEERGGARWLTRATSGPSSPRSRCTRAP